MARWANAPAFPHSGARTQRRKKMHLCCRAPALLIVTLPQRWEGPVAISPSLLQQRQRASECIFLPLKSLEVWGESSLMTILFLSFIGRLNLIFISHCHCEQQHQRIAAVFLKANAHQINIYFKILPSMMEAVKPCERGVRMLIAQLQNILI